MIAVLLNPRVWAALILAAALAFAGVMYLEAEHAKTELAEANAKFDQERAQAAQAAQAAEAAARAEEARRTEATKQVIANAQSQAVQARADADAANSAASGLRSQLAAFVASHRGSTSNPSATGRSPSQQGDDPLDVLAGMFARVDSAGAELAAYSDQLRIRGQACEAWADSLTKK